MKTKTPVLFVFVVAWLLSLADASALYDPGLQRWINRDPVNERGGISLYRFVFGDPINQADLLGLCLVVNNTGQPLVVSGNVGEGDGAGEQLFGVVPHGGTFGGSNPILAYASPEDALDAYNNPWAWDSRDMGLISDVDAIVRDGGSVKIWGDDQGPTVTVNPVAPGIIRTSAPFNEWLESSSRWLDSKLNGLAEWLDVHGLLNCSSGTMMN